MTFSDWREPVRLLARRAQAATPLQKKAARAAGVQLTASTPALVAAALIRSKLESELELADVREPSEAKRDYATRLAKETKSGEIPAEDLSDPLVLDAWIEVLHAKRGKAALERLQLAAGDIVERPGGGLDEVSSVGADGLVFFAGGLGARDRPHRLKRVAKHSSRTNRAKAARKAAANRAAERRSRTLAQPPSAPKMKQMSDWLISNADQADFALLEEIVDGAETEAPVQQYLNSHPQVFRTLMRGTYGNAVIPWQRLGSEFVPDYLLAEADSAGIHWTLVEIESPRKPMLNQDGKLSPKTREAVAQIEAWREWLTDNLDYARRPRGDQGLGLIDMRPERTSGLVIIGRREDALGRSQLDRNRLTSTNSILVHSYDWLFEQRGRLVAPFTGLTNELRQHGAPAALDPWS